MGERLAAIREHLYTQEAATSLHWGEVIYLAVVAVLAVITWAGLVLAEFGLFSPSTLSLPIVLAVGGGAIALRRARRWTKLTWSWDILGVLPALALAVALFTPPFEFILGGSDPGVYVNTGANIARTGAITIVDGELAAVAPDIRRDLVTTRRRLPGFYIVDSSRGVIEPHGFHLYPVLLAIADALGGVRASLWVSPIVAILALLGFYLLARRLFGTGVAFVAALLLVVNPAVIWYARYPAAENLVCFWLMGGLLAFVLAHDVGDRWLAALAGATLAMVHLTKIEQIMLPVALVAFITYQGLARRWRIEYAYFLVPYGLVLVHAIVHAHLFATFYSHTLLRILVLSHLNGQDAALLLAVCLICVLLALLGRNRIARILHDGAWWSSIRPIAITCVLAVAAYAYYVRPYTTEIRVPIATNTPNELIYQWASSASFEIVGWYVSPLGLLLAVIGYITALRQAGTARTAVVLLLTALEVTLQLSEGRITPVHFWAARRYIPFVFPAFALFSGYGLWRLQRSLRGRWPEALTPMLLGAVTFLSCFGGWQPFLEHVEYQGAIAQVETLASRIPEDGVVLFDDSNTGRLLATPLQYLWRRTVFIVPKSLEDDGSAGRLVADWLAKGRAVYWVRNGVPSGTSNGTDDLAPDLNRWGLKSEFVAESTVDLPQVLATVDHRPDTIERLRFDLRIYQVLPLAESR